MVNGTLTRGEESPVVFPVHPSDVQTDICGGHSTWQASVLLPWPKPSIGLIDHLDDPPVRFQLALRQ
jgi:hypothetical protein